MIMIDYDFFEISKKKSYYPYFIKKNHENQLNQRHPHSY